MIAYHFDRFQKLKENSELFLFHIENEQLMSTMELYGFTDVSHWGKSCYDYMVSPTIFTDFNTINSFQIDLVAENIRRSFFPDKPSRFKSIFAVEKLSDFILWKNYFSIDPDSHIFEIEYDPSTCIALDSSFLKGGIDCNPYPQIESLFNYWSGQMSNSPLPELLIPLPTFVRNLVNPSEIIL